MMYILKQWSDCLGEKVRKIKLDVPQKVNKKISLFCKGTVLFPNFSTRMF